MEITKPKAVRRASDAEEKMIKQKSALTWRSHSTFAIRHFTYAPRMNHDHAHRHISKTHRHMAELIRRSRRYEITPAISIRPFDALAESIAYQQLNGKAAATIWAGSERFIQNEMARPCESARHTR
jgi:hypothetical protein